MISRFFIDRPIFAAVLSIFITLTGGIALFSLPIAQYPPITPPAVAVTINYPGASAQVVADTVAAPIEQQVNGVEGMLYMSSQMGNDGSYTLTVTFDIGTDLNTALVMVQNRVQLALPLLPVSVQNQGITIRKKTPDLLNVINFYSPDGRYDDIYLSNYATIHVYDELLRIDGVSQINILGVGNYSMRAWLDPQKLAALNMTASDVADAIRQQNLDAPAGTLGQQPATRTQAFERPIDTLGRLTTPEQFGDLIVKAVPGQPPAPSSVPITLSPANAGLPGSGSVLPLASFGTLPVTRQGTPVPVSAGSAFTNAMGGTGMTGSTTSSSAAGTGTITIGGTTSGNTSSGGGTTGGPLSSSGTTSGNTSGGGGTTPGGALSSGGGTTGGGATLSNTPGAGSRWTGLSITGATSSATGSGVLSSTTLGHGPGRPSAGIVRLRDVARVELGDQNYSLACSFDGHPSVGLGVFQLPGSNALEVANNIRAKMEELKANFPEGIDYQIAYDTTPFIRESVADVVRTLFEAVALVAIVVLVFLQNWRAALIPLVAVPVAIVGTFAVMAALGFSLNNISLFGLVLAIGIVVDDAIVVVENVERWLERGESPREAARKAMDEVTGPVIAVALVLCAVFVPCAFISGITGQFFRQFAVTIAVSTVFSAINSLTLSPALAAILLKPHDARASQTSEVSETSEVLGPRRDPVSWLLDLLLGWFFRLFNWGFGVGTAGYGWVVGRLLRGSVLVLLAYGGLLVLTAWVFHKAPTGFVPQQDQGRIICNIQLPDSASQQRTREAMARIEAIALQTPGVAHTITISGISFVLQANSPNFASMFVVLQPFDQRRSPELSDTAIMARMRAAWAREIKEAQVVAFGAPPIPGLSVAGGFKLMVEDRGGLGLDALQRQTDELVRKLRAQPGLTGASTQFRSSTPQLFADIDRTKVAALGVSLQEVNQTLGMYLGSLYVTSFNEFGRYWQVTIQAEGTYRNRVEDINLLQVRNKWGQMIPLGTLINAREVGGPVNVTRYNLYTATAITGNLAPGASTGDAIQQIGRLSRDSLPISMQSEWTEIMFMQIRAGDTAIYVFALAVVCVFLALAALYESWALPLAVILVVPMCLLCSVAGVLFTHNDVNIFVQIGLVVLVGLACKNAILIVEFARQTHREGRPRFEATVEASRQRLRPILMTSFAFILGVVPLLIATGAGAEMRRSLGTAVFTGMLGVTLFGIFLTPVFFYVIQGLGETRAFEFGAFRRIGSPLLGGLSGFAAGFLLARIIHLRPVWEVAIGVTAALLGALLVLALERMAARRARGRRSGFPA
jgi:multidrug efflux pump